MKPFLIFCICLALLAAGIIFLPSEKNSDAAPVSPTLPVVYAEPLSSPVPSFDEQLSLQVLDGGGVQTLSLEDYLVGVLLAEMSGDFPMEALKAQAIASRTFALKQAMSEKHTLAHVCTDPSCCQGWVDVSLFPSEAVGRAGQAVEETDGLVLSYKEALIDATYFSCSGGQTETALAVWGSDIPYLQSVQSPGEEDAPRFAETVLLEKKDFKKNLLSAYPEANLSGSPEAWFGAVSYTSGGGIDSIFIGGTAVRGTDLRSLFSLRSTNISIETTEDQIILHTRGFGHRVGMSQYGAKAMAEEGRDFESILLHYYSGAQIKLLRFAAREPSTLVLAGR